MTARPRPVAQDGFTIVEVLVAALILVVGLLGTLRALDSSQHLTSSAQREQQALALAQRDVERLSALPWGKLALDAAPAAVADPTYSTPPAFVSGTNLKVLQNFGNPSSPPPAGVSAAGEPLVVQAGTGGAKAGPQTVSVGGTTGKLYEYVTQVDPCLTVAGVSKCPPAGDPQDTMRRIVVAVVLDKAANGIGGVRRPVWVSTVIANRSAGRLDL